MSDPINPYTQQAPYGQGDTGYGQGYGPQGFPGYQASPFAVQRAQSNASTVRTLSFLSFLFGGRADAHYERTCERPISRQDVLDHSSCGPRRCPGGPHRHRGGVGILVGVDLELMSVAPRGSRGLSPEQE